MFKRKPKRVIIEDSYWQPRSPKRGSWLLVVLGIIAVISFLAFSQAALSEPKPSSGGGELILSDHNNKLVARAQPARLAIDIQGMAAMVELEQVFENPSDTWVNGEYIFPLPDNAAVYFMQMRIGERIITSTIKEREEAKKLFKAAQAAGKKAALTQQHRPNIFSQNIANIGPKETVSITLKYSQAIRYNAGQFSLRFPMTITPRYTPNTANLASEMADNQTGNAKETLQTWYNQHSQTNTTNNTIAINIKLNAGLPLAHIGSPYHQLTVKKQHQGHQISTAQPSVRMDRDFVLTWQATAASSPSAASFSETKNAEQYVKMMLLPPAGTPEQLAREALFILDTSGSMAGASIRQAKQSLLLALNRLKPHDFFNVYEFNNSYRQLFASSQAATPANLRNAEQFVQKLYASGGTNMAPPLQAALTSPTSENPVRQVIFITDGSVSNESQLFTLIDQNLHNARLFTVGIGSAPNSYFMRKAAEFGGGTFTHIGSINEVQTNMAALFKKLESPVLTDISLQWQNGTQAEIWPQKIPDLYLGEPLVVYAKLSNRGSKNLVVNGIMANQSWQQPLTIPTQDNSNNGLISRGWARAKIESLLDQKVKGVAESVIREQVLTVALPHHLMSPYTSLIAVEETPSKPSNAQAHDAVIPLAAPKGQNVDSFSYPQTATLGPLHTLLAVLSLVLLILFKGQNRVL